MTDTRFVAIDGESVDDRYVLLMNSHGQYVWDENGLSTSACLKFLLSMRGVVSKPIFVAFGLNYDVNMILGDLGRERIEELWKKQKTHWYGYDLEWLPGKWFRVARGKNTSVKIYETFGFFQMSFVRTLKAWNMEVQDMPEIEAMKTERGEFDLSMRGRIVEYCKRECELLVEVMDALRAALRETGLVPNSWVGAGSIAAALLHSGGVRNHHLYDNDFPNAVHRAIMRAYFGGRIELFKQGHFPRIWEYDIRSAYPSAAVLLPSLVDGSWNYRRDYSDRVRFGLWRCKWDLRSESPTLTPFPIRRKRSICYPLNGHGWYHASEVASARDIFGKHIRVLEGFEFVPSSNDNPFDFVRRAYVERARLKREGHAGEKCIKLGINALYGKLAQGVGYRGSDPPFQSYFWAGAITADTRSRLLDMAAPVAESIVMMATDGLFLESPLDVPLSDELGGIELVLLDDMFTAQPGVYYARDGDFEIKRSRGFFAREIDFDDLRAGFDAERSDYVGEYVSRRFVGAGSALMRRTLDDWRKWVETTRRLSLTPSTKFAVDNGGRYVTHVAPTLDDARLSDPYTPKGGGYRDDDVDYTQGREQPLREY